MVSMTVRNVPKAARDRHAARAGRAGQSLQEYMWALIVDTSNTPTTDEWLESVRGRVERSEATVTTDDIVQVIREDRESR